jgi:hypothetical protein
LLGCETKVFIEHLLHWILGTYPRPRMILMVEIAGIESGVRVTCGSRNIPAISGKGSGRVLPFPIP